MGVGCPNKHFRKLHAFVKTKQCEKCLFVLVSAFERKNDSTQKLQQADGNRGEGKLRSDVSGCPSPLLPAPRPSLSLNVLRENVATSNGFACC